jgi:putative ABC transport system permease protein
VGLVVGSFTFSSILMQRRMREFALLQTLGASRMQVYKVAVGENLLLLSLVILWGVLLGLLLSYVVNGFFTLIRLMFSMNTLPRTVFIPWPAVVVMSVLSLVGMILVMIISAMKAARQDLSVSTRVI